jgi:hypothetical protein
MAEPPNWPKWSAGVGRSDRSTTPTTDHEDELSVQEGETTSSSAEDYEISRRPRKRTTSWDRSVAIAGTSISDVQAETQPSEPGDLAETQWRDTPARWGPSDSVREVVAMTRPTPRSEKRNTNQWTPKLEAMGYGMIQRSNYKAWVFGEMTIVAKWWSEMLAIVSAIITGLLSVESLVEMANPKSGEDTGGLNWIRVATFALSFLATVLLALITIWKPAEGSSASRVAQVKYLQVKRALTLQLALDREERHQGEEFMNTMLDDISAAALTAPIPYAKVLRRAEARFGVRFETQEVEGEIGFEVHIQTQSQSPRRDTYMFPLSRPTGRFNEAVGRTLRMITAGESSSEEVSMPRRSARRRATGLRESAPDVENQEPHLNYRPVLGTVASALEVDDDWEVERDEPLELNPDQVASILSSINEKRCLVH